MESINEHLDIETQIAHNYVTTSFIKWIAKAVDLAHDLISSDYVILEL